jgi:hypothetical protein
MPLVPLPMMATRRRTTNTGYPLATAATRHRPSLLPCGYVRKGHMSESSAAPPNTVHLLHSIVDEILMMQCCFPACRSSALNILHVWKARARAPRSRFLAATYDVAHSQLFSRFSPLSPFLVFPSPLSLAIFKPWASLQSRVHIDASVARHYLDSNFQNHSLPQQAIRKALLSTRFNR